MKPVIPEAPELLALKLRLSIATHVDPFQFADWIRANLGELRARFKCSGEPRPLMGMWLRREFVLERALNSQPALAPTIPALTQSTSREPAGDLHEYFYQQARGKLL